MPDEDREQWRARLAATLAERDARKAEIRQVRREMDRRRRLAKKRHHAERLRAARSGQPTERDIDGT